MKSILTAYRALDPDNPLRVMARRARSFAKGGPFAGPDHAEPKSADEIVSRDGLFLLLDQSSVVDRYVLEKGDWEPELRRRLFELTSELDFGPDAVFLDIGAYFGLYALHAAKSGRFREIHAFEPDKLNFAQLQACLFLNRAVERITAHNIYVGDKSGVAEMTKSSAMIGNRGGAGRYGEKENQATVRVDAIDNLVNYAGRDIVAKIDAENGEFDVLAGMRDTIARNRMLLQIECGSIEGLKAHCTPLGLRHIESVGDHFFTNA